jgi:hypothetical protein
LFTLQGASKLAHSKELAVDAELAKNWSFCWFCNSLGRARIEGYLHQVRASDRSPLQNLNFLQTQIEEALVSARIISADAVSFGA